MSETKQQLISIVERIEKLEEEKAAVADDIKEVYKEAKSNGFDVKTLRVIVNMRKKDNSDIKEEADMLAIYMEIFDLGEFSE